MAIEVTPQTRAVIEQFMATGHYQTEADALQAALDERLDPHTGMMIKDLRPLLQAGLDDLRAGNGIPSSEVNKILAKRFPHDD